MHDLKGIKEVCLETSVKANVFTSKKKSRCAWKHRFVCLAYYGHSKMVTTNTKDDLLKAELGLNFHHSRMASGQKNGNELRIKYSVPHYPPSFVPESGARGIILCPS